MATVECFNAPPQELYTLLDNHLPLSLTLIRRLQFAALPGGSTSHSKVLFASTEGKLSSSPKSFTATYLDISGGPDTQMVLYSTAESDVAGDYASQFQALVSECIKIRQSYGKTYYDGSVLLGSLDGKSQAFLEAIPGRIQSRPSGEYNKFFFDVDKIPDTTNTLPEEMHWGIGTLDDCKVVVSRTDIPRPAEMLFSMPNLFVKLSDGTPIAWAFLGREGSLISVHCEEPYRRKGISRMMAAKLLKDKIKDFGDGTLSTADVSPENVASRAMCKSLGGVPRSTCRWVLLHLHDEVTAA